MAGFSAKLDPVTPAVPDTPSVGDELAAGVRQSWGTTKAQGVGLVGRTAETFGFPNVARSLYDDAAAREAAAQAEGPSIQSPGDVHDLNTGLRYGAGLLGGMAIPAAVGMTGAALSRGGNLSRIAGATAATVPMTFGQQVLAQQADPVQAAQPVGTRNIVGGVVGTGQAAMYNAIPQAMVGKLSARAVAPAWQSTGRIVAKNLGEAVGGNAAASVGATALEQQGASYLNPQRDTSQDEAQLGESAIAGAVPGLVLAPFGIAAEKWHNRKLVPPGGIDLDAGRKPAAGTPSAAPVDPNAPVNLDPGAPPAAPASAAQRAADLGRGAIKTFKDLVSGKRGEPTDLEQAETVAAGKPLIPDPDGLAAAAPDAAAAMVRQNAASAVEKSRQWLGDLFRDNLSDENYAKAVAAKTQLGDKATQMWIASMRVARAGRDVVDQAGKALEEGFKDGRELARTSSDGVSGQDINSARDKYARDVAKQMMRQYGHVDEAAIDQMRRDFIETAQQKQARRPLDDNVIDEDTSRSASTSGAMSATANAIKSVTGSDHKAKAFARGTTGAMIAMRRGGDLDERQSQILHATMGSDAPQVLSAVHDQVFSPGKTAIEKQRSANFHTALKGLVDYQNNQKSLSEVVMASLKPAYGDFVNTRPELMRDMMQHLKDYTRGKHAEGRGKEENDAHDAQWKAALQDAFGPKFEEVVRRFAKDAHDHRDQTTSERAYGDKGESLDPTQAEVDKRNREAETALTAGDTKSWFQEPQYLGTGVGKAAKANPGFMLTEEAHNAAGYKKGDVASLNKLAAARADPKNFGRSVDLISARDWATDNGITESHLAKLLKGGNPDDHVLVEVRGENLPARISGPELEFMRLDQQKGSRSPNKIDFGGGFTLDARKMMQVMRKKDAGRYTEFDKQGAAHRDARMFSEGMAAVSYALDRAPHDFGDPRLREREQNRQKHRNAWDRSELPRTPEEVAAADHAHDLFGFDDKTEVTYEGRTVGDLKKVKFEGNEQPHWRDSAETHAKNAKPLIDALAAADAASKKRGQGPLNPDERAAFRRQFLGDQEARAADARAARDQEMAEVMKSAQEAHLERTGRAMTEDEKDALHRDWLTADVQRKSDWKSGNNADNPNHVKRTSAEEAYGERQTRSQLVNDLGNLQREVEYLGHVGAALRAKVDAGKATSQDKKALKNLRWQWNDKNKRAGWKQEQLDRLDGKGEPHPTTGKVSGRDLVNTEAHVDSGVPMGKLETREVEAKIVNLEKLAARAPEARANEIRARIQELEGSLADAGTERSQTTPREATRDYYASKSVKPLAHGADQPSGRREVGHDENITTSAGQHGAALEQPFYEKVRNGGVERNMTHAQIDAQLPRVEALAIESKAAWLKRTEAALAKLHAQDASADKIKLLTDQLKTPKSREAARMESRATNERIADHLHDLRKQPEVESKSISDKVRVEVAPNEWQVTKIGREAIESRIRSLEAVKPDFTVKSRMVDNARVKAARDTASMARQLDKMFGRLDESEQQSLLAAMANRHMNDAAVGAVVKTLADAHGIRPEKFTKQSAKPAAEAAPKTVADIVNKGGESLQRVIDRVATSTDHLSMQRSVDDILASPSEHSAKALDAINTRLDQLSADNPQVKFELARKQIGPLAGGFAYDTVKRAGIQLTKMADTLPGRMAIRLRDSFREGYDEQRYKSEVKKYLESLRKEGLKNMPPETRKAMEKIVHDVAGDVVKVVWGDGLEERPALHLVTKEGGLQIHFSPLMNKDFGPMFAYHEAAHAVMTRIYESHGHDVAARVVDLANQDYIRDQVRAHDPEAGDYYTGSPEENFVQAFALWATGQLKLKREPLLRRVFDYLRDMLGAHVDKDQSLADIYNAMKHGDATAGSLHTESSYQHFVDRATHQDFIKYNDAFVGEKAMGARPSKKTSAATDDEKKQSFLDRVKAGDTRDIMARVESSLDEAGMQKALDAVGKGDVADALRARLAELDRTDPDKSYSLKLQHASPHEFEKFDWASNMGRGEGAQAYGWGGYFAVPEGGVAKIYKNSFSEEVVSFKGQALDDNALEQLHETEPRTMTAAHIIADLRSPDGVKLNGEDVFRLPQDKRVQAVYDLMEKAYPKQASDKRMIRAVQYAEAIKDLSAEVKPAPLYNVTADLKPHEVMDWDKPLLDQSPELLDKIRNDPKLKSLYDTAVEARATEGGIKVNGSTFYRALSTRLEGDRAASEALDAAGIKGHKYLDGMSRHSGEGTHNYVVYDAKHVGIDSVEYSKARTDPNVHNTAAQRVEVEQYIHKLLGPSVAVKWAKLLHEGDFTKSKLPGVLDAIRLSMHSLDPHSVAAHESLHALMSQLQDSGDHEINRVIFKAADSPYMRRQLEKIYGGDPEVMKQLADSKERAAYMFQAYADPNIKLVVGPKAEHMLGRIAAYIREVFGIWSNDKRALEIMKYFQEGDYAKNIGDRVKIREDLMEQGRNAGWEKMKTLSTPLRSLANSMGGVGEVRLRETGNPFLIKMADAINSPTSRRAESGDTGFINAARVQYSRSMNKLARETGSISEAHMTEAFEAMQREAVATSPEAVKAQAYLRQAYTDAYEYMKRAGVDLGDLGPNYVHRQWDTDTLTRRQGDFKKMIQKYVDAGKVDQKGADRILAKLIGNQGSEIGIETLTPGMQATKTRILDFISAEDAAPYLQKDVYANFNSYLQSAARRGEWTRRFGENNSVLEKWRVQAIKNGATTEQMAMASKFLNGVNGTLGDNLNPSHRRLFANSIVYENIRLLGLGIFSSSPDAAGIFVRGGEVGDAWSTFKRGIKEVGRGLTKPENQKFDAGYRLAEDLGVIDSAIVQHMIGSPYSQDTAGSVKKWNEVYFKYNLMDGYNRSMRVGATVAAAKFIGKHADGTFSEHSTRWLSELGLKPGDVEFKGGKGALRVKGDQQVGTREPLLTRQDFMDAGYSPSEADAKSTVMAGAVNKWVDGAVLRPNAAQKPIWFNDPHFALISHLKQFTYAFQENIIKRVWNEAQHGNYSPAMGLASYVPIMLAADIAKGYIMGGGSQPDWKAGWGVTDYLWAAMQRAGLFGVSQFGIDAVSHQSGAVGLLGPTIEQAAHGLAVLGGKERFGSFFDKSLPAAQVTGQLVSMNAAPEAGGGDPFPMAPD